MGAERISRVLAGRIMGVWRTASVLVGRINEL